ncbi:MAG: hypothetical protein HY749_20415 [Gammaproteobacteria bacterium]|nr:hypothetical protein [Gammaproteobacteria bacterium]MBI5618806.1 hypothetical protein [Gammaproteobacteria bacterium]
MIWPALLLAPSIALCDVLASHALTGQDCTIATSRILYAVQLPSLALVVVCTLLAAAHRRAHAPGTAIDATVMQPCFLAGVASWTGLLSVLVVVAIGIPLWFVPPCAG